MSSAAVTAALAFVSTNIDDIFILMVLYAQVELSSGRLQITAGHYLGMTVLTALGMFGAAGTAILPTRYVGLLGLLPIAMGVKARLQLRREADGKAAYPALGLTGTALLTIANGGDNLGVYTPVFSGLDRDELAVSAAVFFLLTGLWCLAGTSLAGLPRVQRLIRRWQGVLVPTVLAGLGMLILVRHCGG